MLSPFPARKLVTFECAHADFREEDILRAFNALNGDSPILGIDFPKGTVVTVSVKKDQTGPQAQGE